MSGAAAKGWGVQTMTVFPDTVYGHATTQARLQSQTADTVTWARYTSPAACELHGAGIVAALSRIEFQEMSTPVPLHAVIQRTEQQSLEAARARRRLLVVMGRSRRLAAESHHLEMKTLIE